MSDYRCPTTVQLVGHGVVQCEKHLGHGYWHMAMWDDRETPNPAHADEAGADPFVTKRDPFPGAGWYKVTAHGRPPEGQAPAVDAEQVAEAFGFEVVDDLSCLPANPSEPPAGALRCAYDRCQAGGVILAGARWVESVLDGRPYHPGCYAALLATCDDDDPYPWENGDERLNPEGLVQWGDGRP